MPIRTHNDLLDRVANNFWLSQPIWGETQVSTTTLLGGTMARQSLGFSKVLPNPLPTGVTNYFVTAFNTTEASNATALLAKIVNLGSIDISGASGTFTDGSAMPTVTELGVSRVTSSAVIAEVTTALNSAPGSISITYVDQDGNAAEATTAQALGASAVVKSCGMINLNSGDVGVRDITASSRSGGTTPTGVLRFLGIIPVSMINFFGGSTSSDNLVTAGFNLPKLGAGDELRVFVLGANAAKCIYGNIFVVGNN